MSGYLYFGKGKREKFFCIRYYPCKIEYFGLDVDDLVKMTKEGKKGWSVLLTKDIRWLYDYLSDREPTPPPEGYNSYGYLQEVLHTNERIIAIEPGSSFYKELIKWREELRSFLLKALKLGKSIRTSL